MDGGHFHLQCAGTEYGLEQILRSAVRWKGNLRIGVAEHMSLPYGLRGRSFVVDDIRLESPLPGEPADLLDARRGLLVRIVGQA